MEIKQIVRINLNVSDLFFNFQHDNYNAVLKKTSDKDVLIAELRKDAEFFLDCLGELNRWGYTPNDLVLDFFARL